MPRRDMGLHSEDDLSEEETCPDCDEPLRHYDGQTGGMFLCPTHGAVNPGSPKMEVTEPWVGTWYAPDEAALVMIEWVTAAPCDAGWTRGDDDGLPEPMWCRTVGWLIYEGPEVKRLAPHIAPKAGQAAGSINIPTRAIIRAIPLETP